MAYLPDYAELHALSNFSFLRGASHPEELVLRAHALGYRALALTDECSFAGAVRAHFAAKECGLPLIHGTEISVGGQKLVLLATDRRSYGAISSLITTGRRRSKKGTYALTLADVEALAPSGALALWVPGADTSAAAWLAEPRRVAQTELVLLAGPERIACGWWDGDDTRRDYFVATLGDSLAWVYREAGAWYLHGLFA